jgi:hypothetical protein
MKRALEFLGLPEKTSIFAVIPAKTGMTGKSKASKFSVLTRHRWPACLQPPGQ